MAQKIQVRVAKKEQVTENVFFVTFRLVTPPVIQFRSGQNMMLMISPGINRTMSIASPPSEDSELLMVHDVSPMGEGSKWTLNLKVGDMATIVGPTGGALSLNDSSKKKVLIATGTGVAPFHAMILDFYQKFNSRNTASGGGNFLDPLLVSQPRMNEDNHAFDKQSNSVSELGKRSSNISPPAACPQSLLVLYWGLRYEKDVYWKEEFDRIARENPTFSWHLVLSKPTDSWQGLRGHVTEHVAEKEKDMQHSEFYLCGNKAMVEEVRRKLFAQNVPKDQVKTELFY